MTEVLIGIQARSNNTRLPGKCLKDINGVSMLDRVIKACKKSARYINGEKRGIRANICLLVPYDDPLGEEFMDRIDVVYGPEQDVLSRYMQAMEKFRPDFMCRITSDCPLIPPFLITRHIVGAHKYKYDYVSNVDEETRTAPDGWDCEVVSSELMYWLDENAKTISDREHVTPLARSGTPSWARVANIAGYADLSHLKLSVDTQEDLDFVRVYDNILSRKISTAKSKANGYFLI